MSGSLYVDKFYVAQSEFEDIVFGRDLRDGMIVLLESRLLRGDMDSMHSGYDQARVDETNRWCEVTRLEVIAGPQSSPLIRFVGRYPDGTMRVRTYSAAYAWIVKRA